MSRVNIAQIKDASIGRRMLVLMLFVGWVDPEDVMAVFECIEGGVFCDRLLVAIQLYAHRPRLVVGGVPLARTSRFTRL